MQYASFDPEIRVVKIIQILRLATKNMVKPACTTIIDQFGQDPFLVLISCLLSLRTKDTVSLPASLRLFKYAKTPNQMLALPVEQIAELIYPVGFYRRKAINIHEVCRTLIQNFNGRVPGTESELLTIKGVGRKTANLVLGEGFGVPALCVDVHVHRISNRLGLVATLTPEETERALQKLLPKEYWVEFNRLLVMWGQNICLPVSPLCSQCPIADLCPKIGVARRR